MNHTIFSDILSQISNKDIRNFTIECLKDAPEELETVPASSTGKYHPEKANREGGLVWHIQRTCYFGYMFIQSYKWDKDDIKGDIVISALLLHDIGKRKNYRDYFDYVNHPQTAAVMLERHKNLIPEKVFKLIQGCVLHHMGVFGGKWKKELNKYNILELIVHNADLLASRKEIQVQGE